MFSIKWPDNIRRILQAGDGQPLAVWTNVLDIAALNAWIIFRKTTGSKVSRRDFILDLIEGLKQNYMAQRKNTSFRVDILLESRLGKRRKCFSKNCNNATVTTCRLCLQTTSGKCGSASYKVTECDACSSK